MLAALRPQSLARMWFPLGELTKPQVRRLAAEAGLRVAEKPDSQDLCFLAGTDRGRFLARHGDLPATPGEIVDTNGALLGRHAGQHLFTVGQRRGLGVTSAGVPLFVLDKHAGTNRVVVGPRESLRTTRVNVRAVRLHRDPSRVDQVKLRYRSDPIPARAEPTDGEDNGTLTIQLDAPADGAAPGQLACLLDGDVVVGWGTIDRARVPTSAV